MKKLYTILRYHVWFHINQKKIASIFLKTMLFQAFEWWNKFIFIGNILHQQHETTSWCQTKSDLLTHIIDIRYYRKYIKFDYRIRIIIKVIILMDWNQIEALIDIRYTMKVLIKILVDINDKKIQNVSFLSIDKSL